MYDIHLPICNGLATTDGLNMIKKLLIILLLLSLTPISSAQPLDVWFTYTIQGGLVECVGCYSGNLTQYRWNVSTSDNIREGSTGWVDYTGKIAFSTSVSKKTDLIITLSGKNNLEQDSQTQAIRVNHTVPPREQYTEPDYTRGESLGPTDPAPPYILPVASVHLDIRVLLFLAIVVIVLYVFSNRKRLRPIKRRLKDGRLLIIKR